MDKIDKAIIGSLPFPSVIRIEPSGACNLACSHCPTGTISLKRGIMSESTFSRILQEIEPYVSSIRVVVLYHGGEPLLNKRLPEMIRTLRGMGIPFIKTVSNGMLLDVDVAQGLIDSGLDSIEFSLDGKSPGENNFFRRHSDFVTVAQNIKNFLEIRRKSHCSKPKVYISSTQFIQQGEDVCVPPEVPAYLISEFSDQYHEEVEFKCTWAMEWPHMEVSTDIYTAVKFADAPVTFATECDHVVNTITVRWNGDVVPCCYDLTSCAVLGNIADADLSAIWENDNYREFRRAIRNQTPTTLCAKCNVIRHPNTYLAVRPEVLARIG